MPKFFSKSRFTAAVLALSLLQPSLLTVARADPGQVIEQIEFRDITVGDALRILSEQSDLNIIASREAADIHVTMFLRRVTSMEVIEAIAKTYNLWYQRDWNSNIVRIYTVKEYRLEQVEFKKEETEIFTMKNAKNALDLAETIKNLFSERVTLSYGKNEKELMTDLSQRFQRFNMIDGRSTLTSARGGSGGGGGTGSGNNSTSINAGSGGFSGNRVGVSVEGQEHSNRQIEMDEQLRVSTEILRKFANESKDGVQGLITGDAAQSSGLLDQTIRHQAPIYVGVIKHQNRVLVRTRDQDAMNEIRQLYKKLDTESSMLLMEVKVLSIDLSDGYNSLFDFKLKTNNANLSTLDAVNSIGAQEIFDTGLRAASAAFDPSLLATVVSNNFEARLQLLEREGRVTELATPMLMTTNQEVSRVFVGEERPIISGYSASSTVAGGVGLGTGTVVQQPILVPETDLRAIGTTLLLTPNINADRTVGIQILVEQSTLSAGKGTIPVQIGDTLQDASIDLVQERTFSGTVVAKDSTAVAIGGLIQEAASSSEKKVPILGDIPVLGFFFREDGQSRTRRELVIIIKPHIMETPTEAAGVSHEVLEENSIHPNALDADTLDIYSNPDRRHKGYVLEQPYKEYSKQDTFDKYRGRGDSRDFPENRRAATAAAAPSPAQQIYVDLTRYASEAIRLPPEQRRIDPRITPVRLSEFVPVDLTYDSRIKALPIAGWRQGGIYVTAVELHNVSDDRVTVDYRHLKGRWLASTIENETLAGQSDQSHATTYLYLISSQPFEEIVTRAAH